VTKWFSYASGNLEYGKSWNWSFRPKTQTSGFPQFRFSQIKRCAEEQTKETYYEAQDLLWEEA
jgi:hypothetical protein